MAEPYFSENLSDRQIEVMMHYMTVLGANFNDVHYLKTEEYIGDTFPVDVAVFEPVENFKYYTIATVGLSSYRFDENFARSELMMVLPLNWKPVFDKEEYYWAPQLLRDIAYSVISRNKGVNVGQVYLLNNPDGPETYSDETNAVGGIVTFAEMFPFEMFEAKIDDTYTKFFQIVPIESEDVKKLEDLGPAKFIQFNLHDSEGPLMVAKLKEKQVEGIDKLIKQNETALKGSDDKK